MIGADNAVNIYLEFQKGLNKEQAKRLSELAAEIHERMDKRSAAEALILAVEQYQIENYPPDTRYEDAVRAEEIMREIEHGEQT